MPLSAYRFGEFELDCSRYELRREGLPVRLERIPMELLILLAEKGGSVATRQEISERLWGKEVYVDAEHGINTAVRKIRSALRDDAENPRYVRTVPGKGYRFVAEKNGHAEAPEVAAQAIPQPIAPPLEVPPAKPRVGWIPATAAMICLSAIALMVFNIVGIRDRIFVRNPIGPIHSIAVLPLANLSGDPAQDYFADGMTDEFITALAENHSLRVISRTSAMQYKGVSKPLPEIARALGVDGILEGSVNRSADHVHVNLQLIYAPTDTHVWAQSYDRNLRDAMALPEELSQTIATEAKVEAGPTRPLRAITPEAHDDYLRGRYFWFARDFKRSKEYFQKAIQLQPDYAAPWSGLGDIISARGVVGQVPPMPVFRELEQDAGKALELDDSLPDAHNSMAVLNLFSKWDWRKAEAEERRAIELNPNYAEGRHILSYILTVTNRGDEALREQQRANLIDPFQRPWALGQMYIWLRQYDAAIRELRLRAEAQPGDRVTRLLMSQAYWLSGRWTEAEEELEKGYQVSGQDQMAEASHRAFAKGGETAAEKLAVDMLLARAKTQYVSQWGIAFQYALLGDKENTLKCLEGAYRERSPWLVFIQNTPEFDFLHAEPRYQAIVAAMGLPPAQMPVRESKPK